MSINFDTALGIHSQTLLLREKRGEILASNMANADTPDYKARDLDFGALFKQTTMENVGLQRTHSAHLASEQNVGGANLLYRNPQQTSLDGNTVETQIEQAQYSENSIMYESSLYFLKNKFSNLLTAIKGQ